MQLAAALTSQELSELEQFATRRLKKSAFSTERQRALAIHCGQSLLHTAIERFALGEVAFPGGRKLKPHQRTSSEGFMHAIRGAINSLIQHAFEAPEFHHEHLAVGSEESDAYDPRDPDTLALQNELRDLEQHLFTSLTESAGNNQRLLEAIEALQEDCHTGNFKGANHCGISARAKRRARRAAQRKLRRLVTEENIWA